MKNARGILLYKEVFVLLICKPEFNMRKLLFVFSILFPFFSYSQKITESSEVFKGANTIRIKSDLSDEELYKAAGRLLVEESWKIANSDKDFLTIKTETQNRDNFSFRMYLHISVSNQTIIIKGDSFNGGYSFGTIYEKYKSVPTSAFNIMEKYALRLKEIVGSNSLLYTKEKN